MALFLTTTTAESDLPLYRLSGELRIIIYKLVFGKICVKRRTAKACRPKISIGRAQAHANQTSPLKALLLSCKAFFLDALPTYRAVIREYWNSTVFTLPRLYGADFLPSLKRIHPVALARIRRIQFQVGLGLMCAVVEVRTLPESPKVWKACVLNIACGDASKRTPTRVIRSMLQINAI